MFPGIERRLKLSCSLCILIVPVICWTVVVWGLRRGIDLTDEGFYLNSISLPFLYKATYTQFGFILHPIYLLVSGNLVRLRLIGLFSLALASIYFVSEILRFHMIRPSLSKGTRVVLGVGGSCAVLLEYFPWTPTPNYNLLNLFGVLIVFGSWLRILAPSAPWYRANAIAAFALGFAVVALVKPTTAPVLAIGLTGLTLPFGRRAILDVIVGGIFSLFFVLFVLLSIDGNLSALICRYQNSLIYNQISQSGHDVNSSFTVGAGVIICVFVTCLLCSSLKCGGRVNPRYMAVLTALMFAPFAVAFGTNTGFLRSAPRAGIFWVMAMEFFVIVAASPKARLPSLYFTMALSVCAVSIVLERAIQQPYRINGPLWNQTDWLSSMSQQRLVKVDPATAKYFRTLQIGARSGGFQLGTPVIDLSGMGPTTIYVLGGVAVGFAWLNGGYPGSRKVTELAFSTVPYAELRRSWILTAPDGHGHLPTDILSDVGLRFPDDYEEVTHAQTSFMNEQQILWRPRMVDIPSPCSGNCASP